MRTSGRASNTCLTSTEVSLFIAWIHTRFEVHCQAVADGIAYAEWSTKARLNLFSLKLYGCEARDLKNGTFTWNYLKDDIDHTN